MVGAHTAQPLAALPLTDAAYPLRVACARPSPVRRMSIEQAHNVRPYNRYRQARRHLRHRASEVTFEFRGQVVARLAERQRMFTAWL